MIIYLISETLNTISDVDLPTATGLSLIEDNLILSVLPFSNVNSVPRTKSPIVISNDEKLFCSSGKEGFLIKCNLHEFSSDKIVPSKRTKYVPDFLNPIDVPSEFIDRRAHV